MWWFIDQRVQPVMLRAKAIKSTNRMGRFSCLELFIDPDGKIFNLKKRYHLRHRRKNFQECSFRKRNE
jgi:hypothetical protein